MGPEDNWEGRDENLAGVAVNDNVGAGRKGLALCPTHRGKQAGDLFTSRGGPPPRQVWGPGVGSGWAFGTVSPAAVNVGDCGILSRDVILGTGDQSREEAPFLAHSSGCLFISTLPPPLRAHFLTFPPHHPHRDSLPSHIQSLPSPAITSSGVVHTLSSLSHQPAPQPTLPGPQPIPGEVFFHDDIREGRRIFQESIAAI